MSGFCLGILTCATIACAAVAQADGPAERRRMVVANFRAANGDTFSWCGKKESAAMWAASVSDKLNEHFTQTRRFAMIDRKFDAEVQNELARLSDKNADKNDAVRLGRRIGTDYMVVGDVKFSDVHPVPVNPVTGQAMIAASQRFAEISYRIVLVTTGQIEWADSVVINSGEVPATDMSSFVALSADTAARRIAEATLANLFPSEAVGRTGAVETSVRPAAAPIAPPANTSVRGTGNGAVVTPF